MPDNTLTLTLKGEVSLQDFAVSTQQFRTLIQSLSVDVAEETEIEWVVEELDSGSTVITTAGYAPQMEAVDRVVRAFEDVGRSVQAGEVIPYSKQVGDAVVRLTQLINHRVTAIQLETPRLDIVINAPYGERRAEPITYSALGTVTGTIETLNRRRGLNFSLYDDLFDRAVRCYIDKSQESVLRNAWGKRVTVAGRVSRDSETGRPLNVRDVTIHIHEEVEPGSFRRARGVMGEHAPDEPAEDIIRRIRDAW